MRRFPPPWSVEDIDVAFIMKDNAGLAHVYLGNAISVLSSAAAFPE
jgi:hypothetical protein